MHKRSIFTVLLLCLVCIRVSSVQPDEASLKLAVTGLHNNKGHVLVSLYKDGYGYPDKVDKAVRLAKLTITNKTAAVTFTGLPAGTYAFAILHDENDDQKMNTNFFGIPKEGYGFSNNVTGTFGPPSFSKASFVYSGNETQTITIKARY